MPYGTRVEADAYFLLRDLENKWATFSGSQKDRALQISTDQIDKLEFDGRKYSGTQQPLAFPRVLSRFASHGEDVWDVEPSTGAIVVPENVKNACFEQAKFLLVNLGDSLLEKLKQGMTSISIGSTSESYDLKAHSKFVSRRTSLSSEVMAMLDEYIVRWY